MNRIETAKDMLSRTVSWLMDRGFSPEENIDALKGIAEELAEGLSKRT